MVVAPPLEDWAPSVVLAALESVAVVVVVVVVVPPPAPVELVVSVVAAVVIEVDDGASEPLPRPVEIRVPAESNSAPLTGRRFKPLKVTPRPWLRDLALGNGLRAIIERQDVDWIETAAVGEGQLCPLFDSAGLTLQFSGRRSNLARRGSNDHYPRWGAEVTGALPLRGRA